MLIMVLCSVGSGILCGLILGLILSTKMWRRGVAQGKAEAVEMLDTAMGLLDKKVQELAILKGAGAPSDFQRKTAEEVSEWAESVVKLWKNLRQSPQG
jgi:hypothetical protein